MSSTATNKLVRVLQSSDQDFEWFPTTNEMIDTIKKHRLKHLKSDKYRHRRPEDKNKITDAVLDCGSGDGRVLERLTDGEKFAIEKARPLIRSMDRKINIVGTDFEQQTLIDKHVQICFSNPPYSSYSLWATKIIKEAEADAIYLILPVRWQSNESIKIALKQRKTKAEVIGSFDFENAERAARAKVNIVYISLSASAHAFTHWFDENFPMSDCRVQSALDRMKEEQDAQANANNGWRGKRLVFSDGQLAPALVKMYDEDLNTLMESYKGISKIPTNLFTHLNVEIKTIKDSFESEIVGLKKLYWNELFNNLDRITSRLTCAKRKAMLDHMSKRTMVDFTESNIYAIVEWVLKNSMQHYDDQLIDLVDKLVSDSNIKTYKSNRRIWGENDWRYNRKPDDLSHYQLELRIITYLHSAIYQDSWSHRNQNGLSDNCVDFISDVRTVCRNLGYDITGQPGVLEVGEWASNKTKTFHYNDDGVQRVLFEVKAFKNGNVHIKFAKHVILRLNVEFGRLKGWLQDPTNAAEELYRTQEEIAGAWKSNISCLPAAKLLALTFNN